MWLSRRAEVKVKKHTATLALAINAQRNLAKISSKLIDDGQITEQEFQLAINIADQYYSQKKEIRKIKVKQIDQLKDFFDSKLRDIVTSHSREHEVPGKQTIVTSFARAEVSNMQDK